MRVVLLGDFPVNPNVLTGGPQSVLAYLVKGFGDHPSIDLHVVSLAPGLDRDRVDHWAGATIHYVGKPRLPIETLFLRIRRAVHRVLDDIQPEIVHAQDSRLSSWLATESGYPTVITAHSVHGQETKYRSSAFERARISVHEHVFYVYFKNHVRHLICISPYIQEHYLGRVNAGLHSIENPIDDAFFELDPERGVQGRVLFAGLLTRRKRPQLLVEAASMVRPRFPHLSVHIAGGEVDARLVSRLRQAVNFGGLEHNVAFLGHLSEQALLQEYQSASVLVLTSDQETSPMVIQQAMAAGKPVIATRVGGIADLIDHGRTGFLVDRGDAQGIANYLQEILLDPVRARTMGLRARREAIARFRASTVAGRMIDVYKTVVAESVARELVPEPVGASD